MGVAVGCWLGEAVDAGNGSGDGLVLGSGDGAGIGARETVGAADGCAKTLPLATQRWSVITDEAKKCSPVEMTWYIRMGCPPNQSAGSNGHAKHAKKCARRARRRTRS